MPSKTSVLRQLFLAFVAKGIGRFIGLLGGIALIASFAQATFFPTAEIYDLNIVGGGLVVLYLMVGTWGLASTAAFASAEAERLQNSWDATGRFRLPLSQAVDKIMSRMSLDETAASRKLESLLMEGHLQAWARFELEEDGGEFDDREEPVSPSYWATMQLITPLVRGEDVAQTKDNQRGTIYEANISDMRVNDQHLNALIPAPKPKR